MPLHNWKPIPAGIFHHFHLAWIASTAHALNNGLLPDEYYSLAEQYAGSFGPDVLTLQAVATNHLDAPSPPSDRPTSVLSKPRTKPVARTEMEFYRSKQKMLTVRHVSDDEIVAIVEFVSPGNKNHQGRFKEFVEKSAWFLDQRIHLSVVDLFPPTSRDPQGIHGAIWKAISDEKHILPSAKKNRTVVSYECGLVVQAYVQHLSVGDKLPDMPLFLEFGGCVEVPLEQTYRAAFAEVPKRWRDQLKM
jgi:hypothetical protein